MATFNITDPDFQLAFKFTLEHEGEVFENVPGDNGGPTKWGVTWIDCNIWRKESGLPPLTEQEAINTKLSYLTPQIIEKIYFQNYWLPLKGNIFPAPIDIVLFDSGVNCGIFQDVKFLQRVLGVTVDGQFGPNTVNALNNYISLHGSKTVALGILERRKEFYEQLAASQTHDEQFLQGWINRVNNVQVIVNKYPD